MAYKYIVLDIETMGLKPYKDRITCICAKTSENECFSCVDLDEKKILLNFFKFLNKSGVSRIVTANGKDFDIPFILVRSYLNDIPLFTAYSILGGQFDVVDEITHKKISLNDLAALYGFNFKNGNGLQAIQMFSEGRYKELIDYCYNDVLLTEKVYLKLNDLLKRDGKDETEDTQ